MAETIASLLVRIGVDTGDLESAIKSAEETLKDMGEQLSTIGAGLTAGITAPLMGLGVAAGMVAGDVDEATNRIQARLGVTGERAEELGQIAQDVWKNAFGESIREVGDAITIVDQNMKGLSDNEIKTATESAYILSDAFDAEVNESTRAAGQLMKDFGVDSGKAFDMISWGFQNGLNYTDEFLDTLREYSPQFSEMGWTGEQMLNSLKAGFDAGAWSLDKIGDSIKESHLRMGALDKATVEAYQSMGLNAEEYVGKIAKGGEEGNKAFQTIIKKLKEVDDETLRNQLSTDLFGTQYEDLREKVIFAMAGASDSIEGLEGTTERAGEAIQETFGKRITKVWREFQSALLPIGEIMLDMAESVLPHVSKAIADVSKWFENLSPLSQKVAVVLGMIAAAIGPVLMVVGALTTALATVSLPVVGIVAGIMAFIGVLGVAWASSETFRNVVTTAFGKIKEVALQVFDVVASFIGEKITQIKSFWDENGTQILQAVQNVFNGIKAVIDFVMPAVLFVIQFVWNTIKGVINGALNIIMGVVKIFAGLFTADWGLLWEGIKQTLIGAVEFIWNLINLSFIGNILKVLKVFGTAAWTTIKTMGTNIVNAFTSLWTNSVSISNGMVTGVINFFRSLFTQASTIFGTLRTFGASIWNSMKQTIVTIAQNIWTGVTTKISSMATGVKHTFQGIWSSAKEKFNAVKDALINPIQTAYTKVTGFIDKIKSAFSGMAVKIPMPHFSVSNFSLNPKDWVTKGIPKLSVNWYKTGGVFDGDSIIGVGEQPGVKEAVVPLSGTHMKPFAEEIANQLPSGGMNNSPIVINPAPVNIDGYELTQIIFDYIDSKFESNASTELLFKGVRG